MGHSQILIEERIENHDKIITEQNGMTIGTKSKIEKEKEQHLTYADVVQLGVVKKKKEWEEGVSVVKKKKSKREVGRVHDGKRKMSVKK